MRFTAPRTPFLHTLAAAGRAAVGRTGNLPILSCVRLDADRRKVSVTGTDLDLTVTADLDCDVAEPGITAVPARLIADIVRAMSGDTVTVERSDSSQVTVSDGRSRFQIRASDPDGFPKLDTPSGDPHIVDAPQFAAGLTQVLFAASADDARPILTGIYMVPGGSNGLTMVATDSYRLAVRELAVAGDVTGDDHKPVLVPARSLTEVIRNLNDDPTLEVRTDDRLISFAFGSTRITSRLIAGNFPAYHTLLRDSHPHQVTADRAELIESARRVKVMARDSVPARLTITAGHITVSALAQDVGAATETIDAAGYHGDGCTIAFNIGYLIEALDAAHGDTVTIRWVDALKPAFVSGDADHGYTHLLMPVRAV